MAVEKVIESSIVLHREISRQVGHMASPPPPSSLVLPTMVDGNPLPSDGIPPWWAMLSLCYVGRLSLFDVWLAALSLIVGFVLGDWNSVTESSCATASTIAP